MKSLEMGNGSPDKEPKKPIDVAIDWYNLAIRGEKTYVAPILRDAIAEELITSEKASHLYKHQNESEIEKFIAQLNIQIGHARQKRLSKKSLEPIPCNIDKTKELEHETIPVEQLAIRNKKAYDLVCELTSWYLHNNLNANSSQKDKIEKIIELLGFEPQYLISYEYKTAVWGFHVGDNYCVIYNSKKGLSLQVPKDIDGKALEVLLNYLIKKFNCDEKIELNK